MSSSPLSFPEGPRGFQGSHVFPGDGANTGASAASAAGASGVGGAGVSGADADPGASVSGAGADPGDSVSGVGAGSGASRGSGARTAVITPLSGTVASLDSAPDPVFATGTIGAGIAVVPDPGVEIVQITSPIAGTVRRVLPHLYVIENEDASRRVLLQLGIDAGRLGGVGFDVRVGEGQAVTTGSILCTYAPREIGRLGFDPLVLVVGLQTAPGELEFEVMAGEPLNEEQVLYWL